MQASLSISRGAAWRRRARGFTLIELIVVLAIIALLVSIVAPRYYRSVERARENTLRTSLNVMREAIDKFSGDHSRYPDSLQELVDKRYINKLPVDPLTERSDSWLMLPPPPDSLYTSGVFDVRSGAAGQGLDGTPYQDW